MHRMIQTLLLIMIVLLLAGCSDDAFDYAYTASGDGTDPADLKADAQFSGQDDLNVVIKLRPHADPVTVTARFIDPAGDLLQAVEQQVDSGIGTVVIGLDYDQRDDQVNPWQHGRYQVEILIDGEAVKTLYFRVD